MQASAERRILQEGADGDSGGRSACRLTFRWRPAPTPPGGGRRPPCPSAPRRALASRANRRSRRAPRPPAGARPCRRRSARRREPGTALRSPIAPERPGGLMPDLRVRVLERLAQAADCRAAIRSRRAPTRPAAGPVVGILQARRPEPGPPSRRPWRRAPRPPAARTGASRSCSAAVTGATPRGSSSAPSAQAALRRADPLRLLQGADQRRHRAAADRRPGPPRRDGRAWSGCREPATSARGTREGSTGVASPSSRTRPSMASAAPSPCSFSSHAALRPHDGVVCASGRRQLADRALLIERGRRDRTPSAPASNRCVHRLPPVPQIVRIRVADWDSDSGSALGFGIGIGLRHRHRVRDGPSRDVRRLRR